MIKTKALILAAGYATRLYPLTENQPKPLLKVANRPIVEHILEKLKRADNVNEVMIVTNARFYDHFRIWLNHFDYPKEIKIINDGTISNDDRLGAVGDINYVLKEEEINDDLLVIAGDNLFGFQIQDFINHFQQKDINIVRNKFGVAILCNQVSKVVDFEEKPAEPKSTLAATACYVFHKEDLKHVETAVEKGKADNPGDLVKYLVKASEVHGFVFDQHWFDIGCIEGLKKAEEVYTNYELKLLHD